MERMKRAVSLLLCFVMVFGLLPMSTFAAETESVSGTGNLVGGSVYTLDTDGVTANKNYLIVNTNSGTGYALTNNNGRVDATAVQISVSGNKRTITVTDDSNIAWQFSNATSGSVGNGGRYVYPNNGSLALNDRASSSVLSIRYQSDGRYQIYRQGDRYYSVYYNNGWTGYRDRTRIQTVYLYELTSTSDGEAVTFTVTPGSATIAPDGTVNLTGTATVGNTEYDLSKCTVTWETSDRNVATVSNGTVTGVADGTAKITVTLTEVNGTAVAGDGIEVIIPVTVQSKTPVSYSLNGSPVTVAAGAEPDYSGVTLTVTYDDGTTSDLPSGVLTFGDVDTSMPGVKTVDVSYGSWTGTLTVNVVISYDGLDHADMSKAPEYPANGAVRIDKTADSKVFEDTGVVEVELDVAGISVKQGVDVVLVVDVSNSMGWSLENAGASSDSDRIADAGQINKLEIAMNAASQFADILLEGNNGTALDNTLSFVTFAGYDSTFGKDSRDGSVVDSLMEVFRSETSAAAAKTSFMGTTFEVGINTYHLTISDTNGDAIVDGTNRGDTNYDYAFWQASQTVNAIKEANEEKGLDSREVYVIFMTDGAPSHYNHNNKQGTSGRDDRVPSNTNVSYQVNNDYDTNQSTWYDYFSTNANTYAKTLYEEVDGNFMAIGFDLAHGGFTVNGTMWQWTQDQLVASLAQVAHDEKFIDVHATADAVELQKIYSSLATKIRYAGTSAQVTDVVDSDFTLQMSNISGSVTTDENGVATGVTANLDKYGIDRTINVKLYDLWTKAETTDTDLIGTRKKDADGNEIATVVETVSFNDDGTEAYSTVNGVTSGNIMSIGSDGSVIISARYFTYTKTADGVETFKWIIGNITDKEIALSFFAYLKNSLEGHAPKGTYYTNEEAKLEYIDIHGDYAVKIFPVPTAVWGGASTTYEFYLVNENGDPVNRNGDVIPFPNRIIITGPYTEELYLNQGNGYYSREIVAAKVLPAGYTLYDETASYVVNTTSGHHEAGLTISDPADGKKQTTILVSADYENYTQSRVAFGVYYNHIPNNTTVELNPDSVVIDYGKAILVDITNGQATVSTEDGGTTYDVNLVGFARYYADVDVTQSFTNISSLAEYDATYGTFTIEDAANCVVRYSPHALARGVEDIFCVVQLVNTKNAEDSFYMVEQLTVIPATIVYYETNFADGVFTYDSAWNISEDEIDSSASTDQIQSTVQIGTDLYGYDASYNDDGMFSDGESFKALGRGYGSDKKPLTYTLFTFRGTGFDLISRTGAAQGLIKVEVFSDAAMTKVVKTVSVLNKSESNLELYQIPVVSINDLAYNTYYVRIAVDAGYQNLTGIPALNALNRGNEFYFDAIRIYDPVMNVEVANQAYIADGEANNDIYELRSLLLGTGDVPVGWLEPTYEDDENGNDVEIPGVVFVDRDLDSVALANYETIGPNNEVYLKNGQAIGFTLDLSEGFPASIDLGLKSANGTDATVLVEVFGRNEAYTADTDYDEEAWYPFGDDDGLSIKSCTVQFYDLISGAPEWLYDCKYIDVIITSYDEDSILSVTDLKLGWGNRPATVSVVSTYNTLLNSVQVLTKGEEDTEVPEVNYDVVSASFTTTSVKKNKNATLTIVTSDDVESIEVRNSAGKKEKVTVKSVVEADGQKTWTVTFKINTTGNKTFTITGFGEDGTSGASVTASIKVNR